MGIFSKFTKRVTIDPEDLHLPDRAPAPVPQGYLDKGPKGRKVDVDIVGESFRQENVKAVADAAGGNTFEFYIGAENGNPHDKNAVAVYVGNLQVGYVAKDSAKIWRKHIQEALDRGEFIWGEARAASRDQKMYGIFGRIWLPVADSAWSSIQPAQLTTSKFSNAVKKLQTVIDSDYPETLGQMKSLAKRAATAVVPLAAHAAWMESRPEDDSSDKWAEIKSYCEDIFESANDSEFATDPEEFDIISSAEELMEVLEVTSLS